MDIRQRSFSKVRAYQLTCLFREFAARKIIHTERVNLTWSECAKLQYQGMSHKINRHLSSPEPNMATASAWHFKVLDATRSLHKSVANANRSWQRCAFESLERMSKMTEVAKEKMSAAWRACAQILTSHNQFLKNSTTSAAESKSQSWKHAVWRIERLNQVEKVSRDEAWQTAYRVIARNDLRDRKFGWRKTYMASTRLNIRIAQHWQMIEETQATYLTYPIPI